MVTTHLPQSVHLAAGKGLRGQSATFLNQLLDLYKRPVMLLPPVQDVLVAVGGDQDRASDVHVIETGRDLFAASATFLELQLVPVGRCSLIQRLSYPALRHGEAECEVGSQPANIGMMASQ